MTAEGRLSPEDAWAIAESVTPVPVNRGASPVPVVDIVGVDLSGGTKALNLVGAERSTLLLFLSASCHGCRDLFVAAHDPASLGLGNESDLVIVLRPSDAPESGALTGGVASIVSQQAWDSYRVSGPPFFTFLVPNRQTVATEGVAWGAQSVSDAVNAALRGDYAVETPRLDGAS